MHTYSVCMATMGGQSPSPALKLCRQHAGWSSNILAWVILHKETIPFPQVVMSFPDPQNMELQPCPHRMYLQVYRAVGSSMRYITHIDNHEHKSWSKLFAKWTSTQLFIPDSRVKISRLPTCAVVPQIATSNFTW